MMDMWDGEVLRFLSCLLSSDPKAETRLYVTVNGFEFHVYNRTDLYARLQETFGLEPTLLSPKKDEERGREERDKTLERYEQGLRFELSYVFGLFMLNQVSLTLIKKFKT